jgi:hypothetical protein
MKRPTLPYRPSVPLPLGAQRRTKPMSIKLPTCDPAAAFHLVKRFTLFHLLTGGRWPNRKRITDAQLRRAVRDFRATHTEQEYQAVETGAYLAGYRTMAALLKQKREAR